MPDVKRAMDSLPSEARQRIEEVIERFEQAWQSAERPAIDDYLSAEPVDRLAILAELIPIELEYRLKAGERARVERYFARFPELASQPAIVMNLIGHEFQLRRRHEPDLKTVEYGKRFPEYGALLLDQLRRMEIAEIAAAGTHTGRRDASRAIRESPTELPRAGRGGPTTVNWPRVPDYEILGELGRGGMGVVYKARQVKLNRLVALKMILAGELASTNEVDRFRREAEALARLQHPNIVQVYEVEEFNGLPFFSLEYVDGGNLAEQLAGKPQPYRRAAQLVEVLARTMHKAHRAGLVHRDLKPANVLVTRNGTPKITDFGLAKRIDVSTGPTQTGAVMGTPAYMAPEQASGRVHDVGPRTDVYALGAILYEFLTGRPPFCASNPLDTILKVIGEEPVPLRQIQPNVPRDMETICLKCLQKEPQKRYASARALANDLLHYLADEPIAARPVSSIERAWRWCRRNPFVASALAGAAALLIVITFISVRFAMYKNETANKLSAALADVTAEQIRAQEAADRQTETAKRLSAALAEVTAEQVRARQAANRESVERARAEEQRRLALRHLYVVHMNLAQIYWDDCKVKKIADLLDYHKPLLGEEDLRGFEWYYWHRLINSCVTLNAHAGPVYSVAFSPDGKWLASAGSSRIVRVWDMANGRKVLSLKGHNKSVTSVAFSRDGKWLASASFDGTVKIRDAVNGEEKQNLRHAGGFRSVVFSPDGKRLATASDDHTVKVWDTASGQQMLNVKSPGDGPVTGTIAYSPDGNLLALATPSGTFGGIIRLWDAATGHETLTLKCSTAVYHVVFSPDGKRLASSDSYATIKVWDATSGKETLSIKGSGFGVVFSPDNKRLASAYDNTVRLWDATSGQQTLVLKGHTGHVWSVAFSPDGKRLASASDDETVKVWDAVNGQETPTFKGSYPVAFSPDGKQLASNGPDGTVKVWDVATGRETLTLKGALKGYCSSTVFSPNGKRLAFGDPTDETVKVWDLDRAKVVLTLKVPESHRHESHRVCVAYSPDGKRLAVNGNERVKLYDAATGNEIRTFDADVGIQTLGFSPDGKRLASAGYDQTVTVWDVLTGQKKLTLEGHAGGINSVTFSPDGKRLASADCTGIVKLWDAASGQETRTLHTFVPVVAIFSPDGSRLATAGGSVKLWDLAIGEEILTLKAGGSVAFSPDGNRLAAASAEGIKVWDARPDVRSLVTSLVDEFGLRTEVIEHLKRDAFLGPEVRLEALEMAEHLVENPYLLDRISWSVVSRRDASDESYLLALRQAEAACRLQPDAWSSTLGVAQYRLGKYREALASLLHFDRLQLGSELGREPRDVAFLAMTHLKLGEKHEAEAVLVELRKLMKQPSWSGDPESRTFLREAEELIAGKP